MEKTKKIATEFYFIQWFKEIFGKEIWSMLEKFGRTDKKVGIRIQQIKLWFYVKQLNFCPDQEVHSN